MGLIDSPRLRQLRVVGLLLLWLGVAALMWRSYYLVDPVGDARGSHNHAGGLRQGLSLTASELVMAMLIMRPWSYARSWKRAVVALLLFVPGMGIFALLTMHAGGVERLHAAWVATLVIVFAGCAVVSGRATIRAARPTPLPAARVE